MENSRTEFIPSNQAERRGPECSDTECVPPRHCEKHGEYTPRTEKMPFKNNKYMVFGCPECANEAAQEQREAEERQAVEGRRKRLEAKLNRAGIPRRFRMRSFENYQADSVAQQYAKKTARDYADSFSEYSAQGTCLIFTGKTGTGKSHLACAIANQVLSNGHTAVFMTIRELLSRIKQTWRKNAEESEKDVIRLLVSVDLLILDEIGVQFDSDAERLLIFDVINGRYQDVKPTIILSNLPIEHPDDKVQTVRKVLGDRVLDRLREGGGKMIPFDWDSHRKDAGNANE